MSAHTPWSIVYDFVTDPENNAPQRVVDALMRVEAKARRPRFTGSGVAARITVFSDAERQQAKEVALKTLFFGGPIDLVERDREMVLMALRAYESELARLLREEEPK